MAKSRDREDPENNPKARAKVAHAPKAAHAPKVSGAAKGSAATPLADAPARSAGPTRRQVRQIARLVGRLEALGELEARRRRQLQVALERGRKTKRHRQQVDRAVGRVGELIDRLRTLARELESPVPSAAPAPSAAPNLGTKPASKTKTAAAAPAKARKPNAAAVSTAAKPAAPRTGSKPANA